LLRVLEVEVDERADMVHMKKVLIARVRDAVFVKGV
jgi:hypothetical protein